MYYGGGIGGMCASKIIALLTDFGISDGYIGVMKGVILSINPNVVVVDLAHNIRKFDIRYAAFIFLSTYRYFPKGSIFVGVVDPGVGTQREGIILKTKNYYFVGPNNGLFSLVAKDDGIDVIIELKNKEFFLETVSSTFHGRDIFAPVAAHISLGIPLDKFGPRLSLSKFVMIDIAEPKIEKNNYIGEVIAIDSFGNVITNIPGDVLINEKVGTVFLLKKDEEEYALRYVRTYGEANHLESIILVGSHNYVELAVSMGSGAERFKLRPGDRIRLEKLG